MSRYLLLKLNPATWVGATDRQARRYFQEFIEAIPSRMAQFEKSVSIEWVRSDKHIEHFRDDLLLYDKFFATLPMWEYHNPIGKRISVVILNHAKRKELKKLEAEYQLRGEWELSETGQSVATDLAMLIGEYFRTRIPSLMWAIDTVKEDIFYQSTYIRNVEHASAYEMHVHQYAYTILLRTREQQPVFADELIRWTNLIHKDGPTRRVKVRGRAR